MCSSNFDKKTLPLRYALGEATRYMGNNVTRLGHMYMSGLLKLLFLLGRRVRRSCVHVRHNWNILGWFFHIFKSDRTFLGQGIYSISWILCTRILIYHGRFILWVSGILWYGRALIKVHVISISDIFAFDVVLVSLASTIKKCKMFFGQRREKKTYCWLIS